MNRTPLAASVLPLQGWVWVATSGVANTSATNKEYSRVLTGVQAAAACGKIGHPCVGSDSDHQQIVTGSAAIGSLRMSMGQS